MNTKTKELPQSIDIWINKIALPKYPQIDASRLYRDAHDAAATGRLCTCVLGRQSDGQLYFSKHGTYLSLQEDLPLMVQLGYGDTDRLTRLIKPLNAWLELRADAIGNANYPIQETTVLDQELGPSGSKHLCQLLINLSRNKKRKLTIEDNFGKGGTLCIPPRSLLVPPKNVGEEILIDADETVRKISFKTELDTYAGTAFLLRSSRVDENVCAGQSARLTQPRPKVVSWKTAGSIVRVSEDKEIST